MSTENKNKTIYDFTISLPKEVEKAEHKTENGVETITRTKVIENKDVKIVIKRPTRKQRDDSDLEYSRYFFKLQDAGLYTKQQVAKRYNDAGGDLSKPEVDRYIELQTQLTAATMEAQRFLMKGNDITEEEKHAGEAALTTVSIVKREIIDFETQRSEIFNHTADNKAFYRLLNWFTMFLSFKEEDGKLEELFKGNTFEEKLEYFDNKIEEEDPLIMAVKEKLSAYIAYWFTSGAKSKADFKPIEDELNA